MKRSSFLKQSLLASTALILPQNMLAAPKYMDVEHLYAAISAMGIQRYEMGKIPSSDEPSWWRGVKPLNGSAGEVKKICDEIVDFFKSTRSSGKIARIESRINDSNGEQFITMRIILDSKHWSKRQDGLLDALAAKPG